MKRVLTILIMLSIFLIGCSTQVEELNQGIEDDSSDEVVVAPEEAEDNKAILKVPGEDWIVLIDVNGFEDISEGEGFLQTKYTDDYNMMIGVMAQKIEGITDSEACKNFHYTTVMGGKYTGLKKEENFVFSYNMEEGNTKVINYCPYYQGYCFKFMIFKSDINGDPQEAYNLIKSVEFIKEDVSSYKGDSYTIEILE